MTLIVVEGIDGSGKSYLVNQLSNAMENDVTVLHRGPLKKHPLEEYVLALTKTHDPRDSTTLCDRWHLGELIYGPLYRGASRLTPAMHLYVEHVLDSMGAVKLLMMPEFPVVERRITSRGETFLQPQHRRLVYDAYQEVANLHQGWQVIPGGVNPAGLTATVSLAVERAQKASEHRSCAPSYVGTLRPKALFLGHEPSRNPLRPRHSTAMPTYVGTFSEYLHLACISAGIENFGIADPSTTAIRRAWEVLGEPVIIPIGSRAQRKMEDEGFTPDLVLNGRIPQAPYTVYGQRLKESIA